MLFRSAKQQWIAAPTATHAERLVRFRRIRETNAKLLPWVAPNMRATEADLRENLHRLALNEVAARRDCAFCLYPEEMLRSFFTQVIG